MEPLGEWWYKRDAVPLYVARGYFMDKTLTADDFEVIQWNR